MCRFSNVIALVVRSIITRGDSKGNLLFQRKHCVSVLFAHGSGCETRLSIIFIHTLSARRSLVLPHSYLLEQNKNFYIPRSIRHELLAAENHEHVNTRVPENISPILLHPDASLLVSEMHLKVEHVTVWKIGNVI